MKCVLGPRGLLLILASDLRFSQRLSGDLATLPPSGSLSSSGSSPLLWSGWFEPNEWWLGTDDVVCTVRRESVVLQVSISETPASNNPVRFHQRRFCRFLVVYRTLVCSAASILLSGEISYALPESVFFCGQWQPNPATRNPRPEQNIFSLRPRTWNFRVRPGVNNERGQRVRYDEMSRPWPATSCGAETVRPIFTTIDQLLNNPCISIVSTFRKNQPSALTSILRLDEPRNHRSSRQTSSPVTQSIFRHPVPPTGFIVSSKADERVHLNLSTPSINDVVPAQTIRYDKKESGTGVFAAPIM